jgi:hypothetical protein
MLAEQNTQSTFKFAPDLATSAIRIVLNAIPGLQVHVGQANSLSEQGLEIGERLAEVEAVLGKVEFTRWLKHHFTPSIVRYFRNLTKQARLIEKYPELRSRILSLPLCHSAALLAGTEEQIEQILTTDTKWTVALIKEKLTPKKITPGVLASESDWETVRVVFGIGDIESLKEQASIRAAESPISTDHVLEVLVDFGYDIKLIAAKPKQQKFTAEQVQKQVEAALEFTAPELAEPKLLELTEALRARASLQQEFDSCAVESEAKSYLRQQLNQTQRKVTSIASEIFMIDDQPDLEAIRAEALKIAREVAREDAIEAIRNDVEAEVGARYEKSISELLKKVKQLEAELADLNQETETEEAIAPTEPATEKSEIKVDSVVRVIGGGRGDLVGRLGKVLRFEEIESKSVKGLNHEVAIVVFDEGTRYRTEIEIYKYQEFLEVVNISPAEVKRIAIGFHSARELKELRIQKESLEQVYSGEAIAIDLGKALTPAIGQEKVQEMIAEGKNGLTALGRYLYELIIEYATVF